MEQLNPYKAVRLTNRSCPYCGEHLSAESSNLEHTIGRRFVPVGKLHQSWNLLLRACVRCNALKAELEDDISAITMQPDAFGEWAVEDAALKQESKRKAVGSMSRRTKRRVSESSEKRVVQGLLMPGVEVSFTFEAPPQLIPGRVADLASLQLSALFYWSTYDNNLGIGRQPPGDGCLANFAPKDDWGNAIQRSFMQMTEGWKPTLLVVAAGGYFKAAIRRNGLESCWSWALEWNCAVRIIGLFGDAHHVNACVERLAPLPWKHVSQGAGKITRTRENVSLAAADDILFSIMSQALD